MSWIEQCAEAFRLQADLLYARNKKNGATKKSIIKELSLESGISSKVLTKWWRNRPKPVEICVRCKKRPVLTKTNRKRGALSKRSIYYKLCWKCKKDQENKTKTHKKGNTNGCNPM
jgi:hypothetical protein